MYGTENIKIKYSYNKRHKIDKLDEWQNELLRCELELKAKDRQRNKPIYEIFEELRNMDKKFFKKIEEYVNQYTISDHGLFKSDIGKIMISNFIIERFRFLIDYYLIMIPRCKNEHDINRWFGENCNILGLEIERRGRHVRGIDHVCRFGQGLNSLEYNRELIPLSHMFLNEEQKKIFNKFLYSTFAEYLSIELEYLSSNFLVHGHSNKYVDMIICYKKDKELDIPILELSYNQIK